MMKELYSGKEPENVALRDYPLAKMIPKEGGFYGDNFVVPIEYALPGGRSANFSDAQTNIAPTLSKKWVGGHKTNNQVIEISSLLMAASSAKVGAFVSARKREADNGLKMLGKDTALQLYRDGTGSIGQLAASGGISGTTCTPTNAADIRNLEVGMVLEFNDNAGGGDNSGSDGKATVVSKDVSSGTFEVGSVTGTIANSDYYAVAGDWGSWGSADTTDKILGLAAWLPLTAPTSGDSHLGVDRSVDVERLSGHRRNVTSDSIKDNVLILSEQIGGEGGKIDCALLSHANFNTLARDLDAKVEYTDAGGGVDAGFGKIKMHTSAGVVTVYADPACPENRGYLLQKDSWVLKHLKGFPHFADEDGTIIKRRDGSDNYELRARTWSELFCRAPGHNGVFAI
jgi:hypothetical protein